MVFLPKNISYPCYQAAGRCGFSKQAAASQCCSSTAAQMPARSGHRCSPGYPRFRCLVLDRPGCGLSDAVDYQEIDLRSFFTNLICQVLDHLHLPQVSIVASSLGGMLAFYFAQDQPARVVRLVQEGCPAFVQGFRVPPYNLFSSFVARLAAEPRPP